MTTRIVGKAFLDAYRQAAANSGRAPAASAAARQAASGAPGTSSRTMELNRQTGMNLDEAIKILNLNDPKANPSHLIKNYEHLFKVNDQKTGGSFYLQSKVVRAKERVEMEYPPQTQSPASKPGST